MSLNTISKSLCRATRIASALRPHESRTLHQVWQVPCVSINQQQLHSCAGQQRLSPPLSGSLGLKNIRLYSSDNSSSDATEAWRDVSHEQLKDMLASGDIFLVDVRESQELAETGKIDDRAVHIPRKSRFR